MSETGADSGRRYAHFNSPWTVELWHPIFGVLDTTKPVVVVPVRGIVPVAIGAPHVVRVIVP